MFQKFKQQPILDQIPSGDVVVAVSGGADSTALLHLISRISGERKWNVVAGHIQHNLRGTESKRDEDFVRSLAAELQIPFASRSIHPKAVPKNLSKLGLEGAARILRYRALASIARERSAGAVLTAHHADDQAETFLLQILRGSDLPSLAGIRLKNQIEGAPVIRPLLPFSRKEILQYLKSQGLDHCRDSSNRNMDFRRNWVRLKLLPLMRTVQPRIAEKIGDLAAQISASDAFPARLALRRKFKYNIRSRSHSERIQNRRNGMVRSVRLNVPGSTSIPSIKTDFAAVLIRAGEGGAVPGRDRAIGSSLSAWAGEARSFRIFLRTQRSRI
jgi:tRNA(Ile)-lysidine synthase